MIFDVPRRVLLLSAHTDDCEIGMGGTIDRLLFSGCEIHWIIFSNAWQSLPSGLPKNTLLLEQYSVAEHYKIERKNVKILDIPVRNFPQHRQKILDELVKFKKQYQPEIVFCPSLNDVHQDHVTVSKEAIRAFKDTTIFGYIFPWNCLKIEKNLNVELSKDNIVKKVNAISLYKSQKNRPYAFEKSIRALAESNGILAGFEFCEVFEVINIVCKIN